MGYALIWVEIHTFLLNSFFINLENYGEHGVKYVIFFSMEMNIYTINIKTTVTWHRHYYGCHGYKKSNN